MQTEASAKLPIIVDLDGTLVRADTLVENIRHVVRGKGLHYVALLMWWWLTKGRNYLKHIAHDMAGMHGSPLPLRLPLVEWLKKRKEEGREIYLATAAPLAMAEAVAEHVGIFDGVMASSPEHNLKGVHKAEALVKRFPGGFMYIGDSHADHAVWAQAKTVGLAGKGIRFKKLYEKSDKQVQLFADDHPPALRTWMKALRVHQWFKNMLVFAPLLLSGLLLEPVAWVEAGLTFVGLSLLASATYLLNDLWDAPDDRSHWSKQHRPQASGAMGPVEAIAAMGMLGFAGLLLGGLVGHKVFFLLLVYMATTLTYSFWGKQKALVDVTFLAALWTLRLVIGAVAVGVVLSPWLNVFAMFLFLSLSLAKRHTEILRAAAKGKVGLVRGYAASDAPFTLIVGVGSMLASVMVLVLYMMNEAMPAGVYASPQLLWLWPVIFWLGMGRIWLIAHRGELNDDPIVYALKDRASLVLGSALVAVYGMALVSW